MSRKRVTIVALIALLAGIIFGASLVEIRQPERSADKRSGRGDSDDLSSPDSQIGSGLGRDAQIEPGTVYRMPEGPDSVGPPFPEKVVKIARLDLFVDERRVDDAASRAEQIGESMGGYLARSSRTDSGEGIRKATMTIRVPTDRFEEALDKLGELGEIVSLETSVEDHSSKMVDLDPRIRNKEAHRDRLLALMSQAGSVQDTLSIQDRLQGVTEELEVLKAQKASLESRISYASIELSMTEEHLADSDYWSRATRVFVSTLGVVSLAVAPLVAIALFAAPLALGVRIALGRRRGRNRDL
jgi:hypothetical protein